MMRTSSALLFISLVASASLSVAACGGATETAAGGGGGNGGSAGSGASGGSAGAPDQTGVPCDVAQVLANKCLSCHGATPTSGAPMSLVTYDELVAPSKSDPAKTYIERGVVRMQDAAAPMPPGGGATADDIAVFQAWIDAGAPKGDCSSVTDPFSGPVGCQSGQTWNPGSEEGPAMNPGQACINCHKKSGEPDAPIFAVAGTVYPSGHETDNCFGIDGSTPDFSDVVVEVTDANKQIYKLLPGSTGNFHLESASFAFPYTAKVVSSKGERAMSEAQTEGDCNLCHTVNGGGNGSKAPGRIVIPY